MHAADPFAQTYAEARQKFLAAAEAADLDVSSRVHPLLGREGETLALDVALDGSPSAERLLVVSSACHGVEGFCGSGIQVAMLGHAGWRAAARDAGVALLYLHALNPYGFSWLRRVTQENVDLNRNFQDFHAPLPRNPGYEELAALLVPHDWPPTPEVEAAIGRWVAAHGLAAFQAAVSGGQYDYPEGLFFGGQDPTWSNVTLRHVLQDHGRSCERLAWIDLHTGLGPSGVGELIFAGRADDAAGQARARAWWGDALKSMYDGSSVSAQLTGMATFAAYDECPQAAITCAAIEYGTLPVEQVLHALRADQWLENHPETDGAVGAAIKRQVRDAFYTDTPEWKASVVEQAFDVARRALRGLAAN